MINIHINNRLEITVSCRKCGADNGFRFDLAKWKKEPLEGVINEAIRQTNDEGWDVHAETGKAYCSKCKFVVEPGGVAA
jgi:hypothetical protein